MSAVYEQKFTVDSRDIDLTGCARPSAVLGYLQETATMASLALQVSGPECLEKYNCFWMIVRMWLQLDEPLHWNESFTVQTWHRGGRGASIYRDFELYKNNQIIGEAISTWVLADRDTFRLKRMNDVVEFQNTDGGKRCKDKKLHRVAMPNQLSNYCERKMHYSDTDLNGHVNNIKYADFACDALHLENHLTNRFVHQIQLNYINQCMAGETILLHSALSDKEGWVRGSGIDGKERFDCWLLLK